ncbi:PLD nuclease N-terminal domain-containing protein [Demequina zhanjiangensis]|uniref:PLD nuclease N-terminal domain-containing protein n=1 Tax=Demequina zhanjiangensis TaxID=3051659 RepID=A0ABT8FWW8_9MICO|nr:PLD nuclease N-terminal domain-containing protein [Demequina sp. SYSU T00b26]MDN4471390.1 PLD nuclease N-terminal domain-containing protein [Demequina sp. SYSU T00b26]
MRVILFLAYIALVVYCLADAIQHPDSEPYRLPRWAWIVIILLFPYIGAGTWLFLKFVNGGSSARRPAPRAVAPDDDPEYLIWLREQERRRRLEEGDKG